MRIRNRQSAAAGAARNHTAIEGAAMDDGDLAERMAKAAGGDENAVRELLLHFEPEVRMVVRGKLPRSLRSQFDSTDFVQSVWESVFTKDGPELARFTNARHFLGFLAGVARNKVFEEHRRRTRTKKYNLSREEPLYVRRGNRVVPRDVPASDPSPSQETQAGDRLSQLLKGLTPEERQIVLLRRRNLTYAEIGEALNRHESAVRRVIDDIRRRMEDRDWQ
jgi:RNA polymerase sigma-70 factor (ECF subfamily)